MEQQPKISPCAAGSLETLAEDGWESLLACTRLELLGVLEITMEEFADFCSTHHDLNTSLEAAPLWSVESISNLIMRDMEFGFMIWSKKRLVIDMNQTEAYGLLASQVLENGFARMLRHSGYENYAPASVRQLWGQTLIAGLEKLSQKKWPYRLDLEKAASMTHRRRP